MNPIGPAEVLAYVSLAGALAWSASHRAGKSAPAYFLADRSFSAWSVCLSLLVSEVTFVAFVTVAAGAYTGSHTGVQMAVGYAAGRVLVAYTLLPGLFNGTQTTAYQRLHMRFGVFTRWLGTGSFWLARVLRDAVVLWACAFTFAALTGGTQGRALFWMAGVAAVVVGLGGIRAAVRLDIVHAVILGGASVILLGTLAGEGPGWVDALSAASGAGKLGGVSWAFDPSARETLWVGLLGGGAWSMAAFGTDQLAVQRLLAAGSLRQARAAVLGTAALVLVATSVMLTTGTMVWALDPTANLTFSDRLTQLLDGQAAAAAAWVAAAVFVSGVSTLTASALSLGSSVAYDVGAPSTDGERHPSVRVGRAMTLALGAAVLAAAIWWGGSGVAASRALDVTAIVYGVLLGVFIVASLRRADPMRGSPGSFLVSRLDVLIASGAGVTVAVWLTVGVSWTSTRWAPEWRVLVVAAVTVGVGLLARTVRKAVHDPTH